MGSTVTTPMAITSHLVWFYGTAVGRYDIHYVFIIIQWYLVQQEEGIIGKITVPSRDTRFLCQLHDNKIQHSGDITDTTCRPSQ